MTELGELFSDESSFYGTRVTRVLYKSTNTKVQHLPKPWEPKDWG